MERLQKVIANSGLCSRREAENLIETGKVTVNGEVITTMGVKVSKKDHILVNGRTLPESNLVYYVLYKPEGCVSTVEDDKNRKTVLDFVPATERVFPVGRLDYDTSGLLLITNDGTFSNLMTQPTSRIEKEYLVKVEGFLRKETSAKIERGIKIDDYKTRRARIRQVVYNKKTETTSLSLIITEGKYHQVKRMFEAVNHPVIKLKRLRLGVVTLDGLAKGEFRLLKPHEIKQLRHLAKKS